MTRLSWPLGDDPSLLMGFRPDRSSSRTTPNAYTSTLSVTFPYMKYSGARYLHRTVKKTHQLVGTNHRTLGKYNATEKQA